MTGEADTARRLVQLRFEPLWLYVDQVREFCNFFAQATFSDAELGERIGLVVHELVENAIRHGDSRELELSIERCTPHVLVKVSNSTSAESAERLRETFDAQAALPASEAYTRAMQRAITLPENQSGLGLPRVRYEGRVDLELEILPGRVCITARGTT